jgi:RimJ/RimL family protein N-acetyltransferase
MTQPDGLEPLFPRPLSGADVPAPPPGFVPARASIIGETVSLVPLNAEEHGASMYEASHGSEDALRIWDYLAVGRWGTEAAFKAALRDQMANQAMVFYAVVPKDTGIAVGQISYLDIHPQNGVIEIGNIWFGPTLQKTKAATEALFLSLDYPMSELGYRRMQWRCNSLNAKSRAAAKRLGFRFEGIFYNHLIFKRKNRDTTWYSILDDEWPEVRKKLTDWLDIQNFDADGNAKSSLAGAMAERSPSTRSA